MTTYTAPLPAPASGRGVVSTGYEMFHGSVCTRIDQHVRYADGSGTVHVIYVHRSEYRMWDA